MIMKELQVHVHDRALNLMMAVHEKLGLSNSVGFMLWDYACLNQIPWQIDSLDV